MLGYVLLVFHSLKIIHEKVEKGSNVFTLPDYALISSKRFYPSRRLSAVLGVDISYPFSGTWSDWYTS